MKEYRLLNSNGRKFAAYCLLAIALIFVIIGVACCFKYHTIGFSVFCYLAVLPLITGIYYAKTYNSFKRMEYLALNGDKAFGIVKRLYLEKNTKGEIMHFMVDVEYENINGMCVLKRDTKEEIYNKLKEGMSIPIYVEKEYAIFKDEEVLAYLNEENVKKTSNDIYSSTLNDGEIYCGFCGAKISSNEVKCPNCGKEKNYKHY